MTSEQLLDAIELLDDGLIQEAERFYISHRLVKGHRELLELVLPEGGKEIMTVEYLSRRITGFSLSAVRNMPLDGDAL